MRVAHIVRVTPYRAGLYETARDLIQYEREAGIDARIVDGIQKLSITEDRGVPIDQNGYADHADVIVNHSGLAGELNLTQKPIVHMLHGRPHYSFLLEQTGQIAIYTYLYKLAGDPRFKAFVTFWEDFLPYFQNILPTEKLRAITPPVDLQKWTTNGPTGYQFHGKRGAVNIVCTEMWREDKTPYHVLNAAFKYARESNKDVRIHIYGSPNKGTAWGVLKAAIREAGALGECAGFVSGLENVFRAADVVISAQRIATRSVREPLACGAQLVMAPNSHDYTPYMADPEDMNAYPEAIHQALKDKAALPKQCMDRNRISAIEHFNPQDTAKSLIEIIKGAANGGV